MNENIKKLVEQTDIYCDQHWLGHPFYDVKWEEKFAELLVLACANRLTQNDFSSVKGVMLIAGAKLKEHFGVEE